MESILLQNIIGWHFFAYALIFIAMVLEGEMFLFAVAYVTSIGYLHMFPVVFIVFVGVLIGDWLWYEFGRIGPYYIPRVALWFERVAAPLDSHLQQNLHRTIFLSKFVYGVYHAVVARAGTIQVGKKRFLMVDMVATVVWMLLIGGLGYVSGRSAHLFQSYIRFTEIGLLIALLIFFIIAHIFSDHFRKSL